MVAEVEPTGKRFELSVEADKDQYTFAFSRAKSKLRVLGGETRYLATEVAGGFTGVYIGLYATGNGSPSAAPAHFDWFDYEAL